MTTWLDIALQSGWIFLASLLLALLEIQVEGPDGWAKNLPTWRDQPAWASPGNPLFGLMRRAFSFVSGGNRLTGYHLYMLSFIVVAMTFPTFFSPRPWQTLGLCLGQFLLMTVTWDFLWFVWNPHYGLRRFKPSNIAWHPRWLGPMPASYPGGYAMGGALIALSCGPWRETWRQGLVAVGVHAGLVLLSVIAAELVRPDRRR